MKHTSWLVAVALIASTAFITNSALGWHEVKDGKVTIVEQGNSSHPAERITLSVTVHSVCHKTPGLAAAELDDYSKLVQDELKAFLKEKGGDKQRNKSVTRLTKTFVDSRQHRVSYEDKESGEIRQRYVRTCPRKFAASQSHMIITEHIADIAQLQYDILNLEDDDGQPLPVGAKEGEKGVQTWVDNPSGGAPGLYRDTREAEQLKADSDALRRATARFKNLVGENANLYQAIPDIGPPTAQGAGNQLERAYSGIRASSADKGAGPQTSVEADEIPTNSVLQFVWRRDK